MKVLLLNGSPHEKGCTYTALSEVAAQLEKRGVSTEIFWIGNKAVQGCAGCYACRNGHGGCVFQDEIYCALVEELKKCADIITDTDYRMQQIAEAVHLLRED